LKAETGGSQVQKHYGLHRSSQEKKKNRTKETNSTPHKLQMMPATPWFILRTNSEFFIVTYQDPAISDCHAPFWLHLSPLNSPSPVATLALCQVLEWVLPCLGDFTLLAPSVFYPDLWLFASFSSFGIQFPCHLLEVISWHLLDGDRLALSPLIGLHSCSLLFFLSICHRL
jgi:hypothetical protein